MYAVIESGGKQYRVELGNELEVDKLDAAPGDTVEIDRVLLVADGDSSQIGRPMVEGALVSASIVRQDRGDKIVVFKYRPKARTRVKRGHRQDLTVIRIADIRFDGRSAAEEAEADAKKEEQARSKAEKEAARQAAADQALAARLADELAADAKADAEKAEAEAGAAAEAGKTRRRAKPPKADDTAGSAEAAKPDDTEAGKATTTAKAAKTDRTAAEAAKPDEAKPDETKPDETKAEDATGDTEADQATTDPTTPKRRRTKKDE
jgi:large subunit ribosomal protein L21